MLMSMYMLHVSMVNMDTDMGRDNDTDRDMDKDTDADMDTDKNMVTDQWKIERSEYGMHPTNGGLRLAD
jgi:hypothetical protein